MRLRLRHNHLMAIGVVNAVSVAELFIHPTRAASCAEFSTRPHVGEMIPPWFAAVTAVVCLGTAAIPGLTCTSAEEIEDWSVHSHRRRVEVDQD